MVLLLKFLSLFIFFSITTPTPSFLVSGSGGQWQFLNKSIGISGMHMQLLNNDRVVIFDRTDFGHSNISLAAGKCKDMFLKSKEIDCTAHSVEYDVVAKTIRPLTVHSDVWCSSGSVFPDGRLIQTGGYTAGDRAVRTYTPCNDCDWEENRFALERRRWYATNQILPNGEVVVIGGRQQFNFEFYPKTRAPNAYSLRFLVETFDSKIENNLYPFVFLNVDGNLFIFANNRAILLDVYKNIVVKTYPMIPGGDPRNYPSTGSAVLLPLKNLGATFAEAEVLICGGAPRDSYPKVRAKNFVPALNTCGRIKITDPNPQWEMDTMPHARVMGDMITLPNGNVLIINGAGLGTAGWVSARDPVFNPDLYRPDNALGSRFETQNPTTIPRMYHSAAVLLRDGRVLISGSNPNEFYNFTGVEFPTELSIEAFSPDYLDQQFANIRPTITSSDSKITYNQKLKIGFTVSSKLNVNSVKVTIVAPSFTTHSFAMNQRLLVLESQRLSRVGDTRTVDVTTPRTNLQAPPGFYLLFVVHNDIPSEGVWVNLM